MDSRPAVVVDTRRATGASDSTVASATPDPKIEALQDVPDGTTLAPTPGADGDTEDSRFNRFSKRRKAAIVATVSFASFLAPTSSTSVLSAVPEVAATFK